MVRVRFAPSPTGYLHIGNGRTALFNWLFAKKKGGVFILRIEDTDVDRSKGDFVNHIMADLRWLGLEWDEGPDKGGAYGPYRQSDRLSTYKKYAEQLLKEGKAYSCYCTEEALEARRTEALQNGEAPRYDNRCRNLSPSQIARFEDEGRTPATRFRVSGETIVVDDLIRGDVAFDTSLIGDFIIMRSNGRPSFHFAVTVDDVLMEITHVIRGEDHLPNTPKHLMLFKALGFKPPQFAHMSMTLGPDGQRLSKRTHATSILHYRESGYLPEALLNYMALLGWSPQKDREILSPEELIGEFQIEGMTKSSAIFDRDKLDWISGNHIRKAALRRITDLAIDYLKQKGFIAGEISEAQYEWLTRVVNAVKDHLSCMSEITKYAEMFFKPTIEIKTDEAKAIISHERAKSVLKAMVEELRKIDTIDENSFSNLIEHVKTKTKTHGKELYLPIRIALTGQFHGPELIHILPILGIEKSLKRIEKAIRI